MRVEADVSFPTKVLVGQPYHLQIQLVPPEGDPSGGSHELPRPHGDDGTMDFLVSSNSPALPAATSSLRINVSISMVAENFKFDGDCRAEIVVAPDSNSPVLQFSLQGLDAWPRPSDD